MFCIGIVTTNNCVQRLLLPLKDEHGQHDKFKTRNEQWEREVNPQTYPLVLVISTEIYMILLHNILRL
jgi:hypothetical protein